MIPWLLVFIGVVSMWVAAGVAGPAVLLPPALLFVVVPLLDQVVPPNHDNTPLPGSLRWLPRLFVPVHLLTQAWAVHRIVAGGLAPWEQGLLTLACGFTTALAINVAHELMHRPGRLDQGLATLLMTTASYPHFVTEHVQGHHKHVGTPRDPATARAGESLYTYLPRTLLGSLRSAWRIEQARGGWGLRNRMWTYAAAWGALVVLCGLTVGVAGIVVFGMQSVVAITMLETINYVEHYGLRRAEIAPGRPERVSPRHSWNASHRVSNWMLLNLARHSDHHAFAARPFTELRHHDDVPQLPASYPAMILLATVPPLWFRVMDPRVARLGAPVAA